VDEGSIESMFEWCQIRAINMEAAGERERAIAAACVYGWRY